MSTRSLRSLVALVALVAVFMGTSHVAAAQPSGVDISIHFDDVAAPCTFLETVALRDEYADMGVHFRGVGARNGGGILDECGGFGVSGHSPPNFLALNDFALYSDGGIPTDPQRISFDTPVTSVEVKVAHGADAPGSVVIEAFDASGNLVDWARMGLTTVLTPIAVSASEITSVRIRSRAEVWVLDDLLATS